jgi:hypothetical protein
VIQQDDRMFMFQAVRVVNDCDVKMQQVWDLSSNPPCLIFREHGMKYDIWHL